MGGLRLGVDVGDFGDGGLQTIGRRRNEVGHIESEHFLAEAGRTGRIPEDGAEVVGYADEGTAHALGPGTEPVKVQPIRRGEGR